MRGKAEQPTPTPALGSAIDGELLALAAEFRTVDVRLMAINAEITADTSDTMSMDKGEPAAVHDRWWAIVDRAIELPAYTMAGWAAKAAMIPPVIRDVWGTASGAANINLALSLARDLTGQTGPGPDADLLAACEAFHAAHLVLKAPLAAANEAQNREDDARLESWYAALAAMVAIPARTAAGQQAKARAAHVALVDALDGEDPACHREEMAVLSVLAELTGIPLLLPASDTQPDVAEAHVIEPTRLTEDEEMEDYAIFDLESVFFDMRSDIAIIGHIATSEREVTPEVWRRIEDHLDLACDTLETSWEAARKHRHVLHDALKAERAAYKALQRARIEKAAPGSAEDIERAEALWQMTRALGTMMARQAGEALPSVPDLAGEV